MVAEEATWIGEWTGEWVGDSPAEDGGWSQVTDAGLPVGGTRVVGLPRTVRLPWTEEAAAIGTASWDPGTGWREAVTSSLLCTSATFRPQTYQDRHHDSLTCSCETSAGP